MVQSRPDGASSSLIDPEERSVSGPSVVAGFAAALTVWTTWYITHLPALGLRESLSIPIILWAWSLSIFVCVRGLGNRAVTIGLLGGGVSAMLGLLILGSKLVAPGGAPAEGTVPSAFLIAAGFVAGGFFLGALWGVVGSFVPREPRSEAWLPKFAIVAAMSVIPLLVAGGLVTSTDAGMAVPDWPNTFGSNMFLYPLGPRVQPLMGEAYRDVYLEHAHRLFGAFVGLTTLTLMVWTLASERRRWVKVLAVVAFALICVQGVLGGLRVIENQRVLGAIHGISGQLIFGLVVAIAAVMSGPFRSLSAVDAPANPRRLRLVTTAALHLTLLQLVFGAIYRHFRSDHVLYSHIAFSVLVLIAALVAGFLIRGRIDSNPARIGCRVFRRTGALIVAAVTLQFLLGWLAFFAGGKAIGAATTLQALVRTAHQANGALLIACLTVAVVFARGLTALSSARQGAAAA